ncbi:MAG: triose-phosphate isomerase [Candidatus Aenigmarchaeota archaeon ex4484_56]|nr:MAG: triose-phosphate isomerase [Candidatus Aenigmarchaeota archaeon ex4484_56]
MLYLINCKTYEKGTGKHAVELANIISELRNKLEVDIQIAVQFTDIKEVSKIIPTYAQHIDPITYGSHTGSVLPNAVKDAGAVGTLINHSEKKLSLAEIEKCINIAKLLNLKTVCCAGDLREVMEIAKFSPDYIAYEDPELIGTGRSISQTKPELIRKFVEIIEELNSQIIPLCGAGISNKEDVKKAMELGVKGVLVASAVVKAENQREALLSLVL